MQWWPIRTIFRDTSSCRIVRAVCHRCPLVSPERFPHSVTRTDRPVAEFVPEKWLNTSIRTSIAAYPHASAPSQLDSQLTFITNYGGPRILTWASLWLIRASKPSVDQTVESDSGRDEGFEVHLALLYQSDRDRMVVRAREGTAQIDLFKHELLHADGGRVTPDRDADDDTSGPDCI